MPAEDEGDIPNINYTALALSFFDLRSIYEGQESSVGPQRANP